MKCLSYTWVSHPSELPQSHLVRLLLTHFLTPTFVLLLGLRFVFCLFFCVCFSLFFPIFLFPHFLDSTGKTATVKPWLWPKNLFFLAFPLTTHLVVLVKTGTTGPYKFLFITQVNPWLLFHLNCWDLNKIKSNQNIHVYLTLNENYQKKKAFSLWAISNHSQTHDRTQFHDP